MKKLVLLILFLQFTNTIFAQEPMYSAAEKSRENMRKSNESLNAVYEANRPNAASRTNNTGFTEAEAEQINNEWNRIWGKPKPSEVDIAKRDAERAESNRKYQEQNDRNNQIWAKQRERFELDSKPFCQLLFQRGFTQQDADRLSERYVGRKHGMYGIYSNESYDYITETQDAVNALSYFNQNYETADFKVLKLCIDKVAEIGASETATKLIDLLLEKPGIKEEELLELQNKKFKIFFSRYTFIKPSYAKENRIAIENYFVYEAKNPKVNLVVLEDQERFGNDAYEIVCNYYQERARYYADEYKGKIKREDLENHQKLILQELKIKALNGIPNCKINPFQMLLDEVKSTSKLTRNIYLYENKYYNSFEYDSNFKVQTFKDGRIFYGKNGKYGIPKGKCIFIYKNKAFYQGLMSGTTVDPIKNGLGTITFPNGYNVSANFKNNIPDDAEYYNEMGLAILKEDFEKFCDMKSVETENSYVPQNGYGLVEYTTKSNYEGNFKDGQKSGEGTMTFDDGTWYTGDWLNDKYHGMGTINTMNGSYYYHGNFINGNKEGYGAEKYADGQYYIGSFSNNYRNGYGTYIFADNSKTVGNFVNGNAEGQGTFTWPNGDKYVGELKSGKIHGVGTIYSAAGAIIFSGNFINGNRQ